MEKESEETGEIETNKAQQRKRTRVTETGKRYEKVRDRERETERETDRQTDRESWRKRVRKQEKEKRRIKDSKEKERR